MYYLAIAHSLLIASAVACDVEYVVKGKLRASLGMLGLVRRQPRTEESIKDFTQRIFGKQSRICF